MAKLLIFDFFFRFLELIPYKLLGKHLFRDRPLRFFRARLRFRHGLLRGQRKLARKLLFKTNSNFVNLKHTNVPDITL